MFDPFKNIINFAHAMIAAVEVSTEWVNIHHNA